LLCYTEALGKWLPGAPRRRSRETFEAFFKRLGPCYEAFIASGENPYDFYRNGMVHEYLAKGTCEIAMLDDPTSPAACGVLVEDGVYAFVVERYYQDFVVAAARLYKELVGRRHPLIHIRAPHLFPYAMGRKGINEDLR
jgi:hypothetical protein